MSARRGWRLAIDRGGTFTDLVAEDPNGQLQVRKLLSVQPGRRGDPAISALRELLGLAPGEPLPPGLVEEVRLGTTVATNALLERRAAPVLLLVNQGFADLPLIADQQRPDLFALRIERPQLPDLQVVEVEGRLASDGRQLCPLRLDADLEQRLRQAQANGYRSIAVALLHAYREPRHELELGQWLQERGFGEPVLSHQVSQRPRLVPRLITTVLEAALRPVLRAYLEQVGLALGPQTPLRVMTSSGGLQDPVSLAAKDTILSGPAGGMVGALTAARRAGFTQRPVLGFDMGGTSTDVFHAGPQGDAADLERSDETLLAGLRLQASMLPIHTVAAGGGSVLHVADGRLQVGPASAGADPGPACYGRGGPLTITDANLLLGRLPPEALPPVFGPHGDQPADPLAVERGFEALARQLATAAEAAEGRPGITPPQIARAALRIAIERMAEAIRRISIQRGHDIAEAVLVCFGGAGGQHACALADVLGIGRVLLHPLAGVLSAWGIGLAPAQQRREQSLRLPFAAAALAQLPERVDELEQACRTALQQAGELRADRVPQRHVLLELRYPAMDSGLSVPWSPGSRAEALREAFEERHRRRFGYVLGGEALVLERLSVELSVEAPQREVERLEPVPPPQAAGSGRGGAAVAEPDDDAPCWPQVPRFRREQLAPGQRLRGPVLVLEATGTIVLEPGWQARVLPGGELLLERAPVAQQAHFSQAQEGPPLPVAPIAGAGAEPDPLRLELFNHRFAAIAEQMGVRLQQSARSVNIRERLDFSCALFDRQGRLVANAPHIPVHLGSMGESVQALRAAVARAELPPLCPGDAVASNDPYAGGTHLPDITLITPVFDPMRDPGADPAAGEPVAYVACRGHHADVGGITPGSMPPFSRSIDEEGLLLTHVPLLQAGRFLEDDWRRRLAAGPHPVRDPDQLLADLRAQLAANQLGVQELQRLLRREGSASVLRWMEHVQANAAEAVRRVIDRLVDGSHRVELDDGSRLVVAVRVDRRARRLQVDCSGSSGQLPGNGNAPLAITRAVVLYVMRCLVARPIPLNAGCFEPIDLLVPEGCLLHPRPPAAVVAGNVETSQALANALFAALGVMAAAQGTMNNLSFGDGRRQYYETICGGTGAGCGPDGQGFAGADAVQSHMTNSRLTDPEILEDRYPVRLERFAIRRGSGGAGRWPGGDGVVRELCFLEPMTVALLMGSRRVAPFGLAGGAAGRPGRNAILRADGRLEELPGSAQLQVKAGDRLRIETPGGGGWGSALGAGGAGGEQVDRREAQRDAEQGADGPDAVAGPLHDQHAAEDGGDDAVEQHQRAGRTLA